MGDYFDIGKEVQQSQLLNCPHCGKQVEIYVNYNSFGTHLILEIKCCSLMSVTINPNTEKMSAEKQRELLNELVTTWNKRIPRRNKRV